MDPGSILHTVAAPVRALGGWASPHWRRLRSQPNISITIGEIKWGGFHPYPNDSDVTEIVMWIGLNNAGSNQGGISNIWVEATGMAPLYPNEPLTEAEIQEIRSRNPAVHPQTGTWLRLPLTVPAWDARAGFMEFPIRGRAREMKFETVRSIWP